VEPLAVGFILSIGTAALIGIFVGALGGAVVWRLRMNLLWGGLLTAIAFVVCLILENGGRTLFMKAEFMWGTPALILAFLLISLLAPWLASRIKLRPTWTGLIALLLVLVFGFMYLFLFRLNLAAPLWVALGADVCLLFLLIRNRVRLRTTV
jgi:hypothetical protein